jgi:hypothetical protein
MLSHLVASSLGHTHPVWRLGCVQHVSAGVFRCGGWEPVFVDRILGMFVVVVVVVVWLAGGLLMRCAAGAWGVGLTKSLWVCHQLPAVVYIYTVL